MRAPRTLRALLIAGLVAAATAGEATTPKATLRPFASEAELAALFAKWTEEHKRKYGERRAEMGVNAQALTSSLVAAPAAADQESATNVQHAGVDEGGIVKLHGEHLVILRRGRLFTVELQGLKPVSTVDAFGPDIDPRHAWHDEMLIWRDTVVVIGYSYARGRT